MPNRNKLVFVQQSVVVYFQFDPWSITCVFIYTGRLAVRKLNSNRVFTVLLYDAV